MRSLSKKIILTPAVIVISDFNDFSYARKAIRYVVKDYLLKPLVDDDLIKLLDDISKRLQKHTFTLLANPTEEERANPCAMLFRLHRMQIYLPDA